MCMRIFVYSRAARAELSELAAAEAPAVSEMVRVGAGLLALKARHS